mmetsp:Transcript_119430/g.244275  ORF Transcript_119430/g.244275 Transcript_119430/m.244275 type:complete len:389 (-) Transcript_119430:150-1316(-)
MPRPSRLGLGATPKITEDAPDTHSRRRPRRHDQLQREERLKRQREEMEKERQRQLSLDKQRVLQLGSIVSVSNENGGGSSRGGQRRAIIKKLAGVPGLNMILVQFEGEAAPTKVKKGSIELVERTDLNERPFRHAKEEPGERIGEGAPSTYPNEDRKQRGFEKGDRDRRSPSGRSSDDRRREKKSERSSRYRNGDDDGYGRHRDRDHRDRERDRDYRTRDGDRHRSRDDDRYKRRRDDEKRRDDDKKRHRSTEPTEYSHSSHFRSSSSVSWLIPNIRVRVVSSKYGETAYKEKGVVVDVTRKGVATLKMGDGQVINVAERHLETALPKVGGRSIILSGDKRLLKGELLDRDSKKNRGVVQVFEDMSIVTTSLDDMAEWCGPLDDDLEN